LSKQKLALIVVSLKKGIIETHRKNKLNMSKPCPGCLSLIYQFNIGEVWYSDKNGQIVKHNENKQSRK
jgi:tRNA(Arg) A34 adenosine deaminase TadA